MGKKSGYRLKKKNNTYIFKNNYVEGFTEKGEKFILDLEDFDKIKNFYWHIENGYARRRVRVEGGKRKRIQMQHFILGVDPKTMIDHIDRNRANNCKNNLRPCNKSTNGMNGGVPKDSSTGIRGVRHYKDKYSVYITENGKRHYLGLYSTIEEAANVRKQAEEKYFGEFAPKQ
jgi:hypothetical protein